MRVHSLLIGFLLFGSFLATGPASADCLEYGAYLHWIGGMGTPGTAYGVAVSGTLAYVTDGQLRIIDMADPQNPVLVASLAVPSGASSVTVAGGYAYVGGAGLAIVDISDPQSPHVVGSLELPNGVIQAAASGTLVYVACNYAGLQVVDVADPQNPTVIGAVGMPDSAQGVALCGAYAYVADYEAGLKVVNITDPRNPVVVGNVATPHFAYRVAVRDAYAYVADADLNSSADSRLDVIDVTDPQQPRIVASALLPDWPLDLEILGTHALLACHYAGLQVIDIANTQQPRVTGSVAMSCAYGVGASGALVCVGVECRWTGGNGRLEIVDATSTENAPLVGSVSLPDEAYGVAVSGAYACVADRTSGLQVVNVSDPRHLRLVGEADVFWAIRVAIAGRYAYVSCGYSNTLQVVDIGNPASPQVVASVQLPDQPFGVVISGGYAYVADFGWGLAVIDVSNPHQPALVGHVAVPWYAEDVAVLGTHAYVADIVGLEVVDVTDPHAPVIVGHLATSGSAKGVAVSRPGSGSPVYVGVTAPTYPFSGTMLVVDVTDPAAPAVLGSIGMPGAVGCLTTAGSYAYVGANGLQVVDISDQQRPRVVGSVGEGGAPFLAGGYVFVATVNSHGLQIASMQCEPARLPESAAAASGLRLAGFPNPAVGRTTLRLELPAQSPVCAAIYDAAGRRVRRLREGLLNGGLHELPWDTRDDQGRMVAPGTYLARVSSAEGVAVTRFVVLR
jgi:hypothetical protein